MVDSPSDNTQTHKVVGPHSPRGRVGGQKSLKIPNSGKVKPGGGDNGDCVPTSDHMSESHRLCVIDSVFIHDPCPPTSANGRNGLTVVGSVGLCAVGYDYGWIRVCEIRSVGCIRGPDALLTIHLGLQGKTVHCSLSQLPDVAS